MEKMQGVEAATERNKKIVLAKIIEHANIAKGIYKLVLEAPEAAQTARAGQFINVYLQDQSLLLPRPISICEVREKAIVLVYGVVGQGTEALSHYNNGMLLRISTANGNGFMPEMAFSSPQPKRLLLVGGGIGVPPLFQLAKELHKRRLEQKVSCQITAIIGFQKEPFLQEPLKQYCDQVLVTTDQGTYGFHGNVVELLRQQGEKYDYGFACGPKVMLKALSAYSQEENMPLQISMEERMGCGYGACVGCVCKIRATKAADDKAKDNENVSDNYDYKKVCHDGPVFFANEVIFDE